MLALFNEVAKMADDLPRPCRLVRRLLHEIAHARGFGRIELAQNTPGGTQIIHDRGKRLVQLMRERRGHLPHFIEAGHVNEFGLRFLKLPLGFPPRSDVMHDADENPQFVEMALTDGKINRKGRPILAPRRDLAPDADDLLLAGLAIVFQIAVMLFAVGLGHEHADVLAGHLFRGVAEQCLARIVIDEQIAPLVDDQNSIDGSLEQHAKKCSAISILKCRAASHTAPHTSFFSLLDVDYARGTRMRASIRYHQ